MAPQMLLTYSVAAEDVTSTIAATPTPARERALLAHWRAIKLPKPPREESAAMRSAVARCRVPSLTTKFET
jgi:hypothetical protein